MNVLTISELTKHFGKTTALDGISFVVERGDIFGFLGPNGAGKSTTLRCLMDFERPDGGEVQMLGKDSRLEAASLKKKVSYVPAEPNLYANWTVDQHIKFVGNFQNIDTSQASDLKQKLSLDGHKKVRHLSTGNQQKLAIILALITKPELLLLDEPTRGLDPLLRSLFHDLLREYQSGGGTVLLSSHDLSEVEELCTNVAIIQAGKLVRDTTIEKLKEASTHRVRVSFAKAPPDLKGLELDNLVKTKTTATFTMKGDVQPLIDFLAKQSVKDLEISGANLEDIFMELYR